MNSYEIPGSKHCQFLRKRGVCVCAGVACFSCKTEEKKINSKDCNFKVFGESRSQKTKGEKIPE